MRLYTVIPSQCGQPNFEACLTKLMKLGANPARTVDDAIIQATNLAVNGDRISGDLVRIQVYDDCDDEVAPLPKPKPVVPAVYRVIQQRWQCNDLRVTVTQSGPFTWNYDIAGTIWGGINFTSNGSNLYLRGKRCVPVH